MAGERIGVSREPNKGQSLHHLIVIAVFASVGCTADQNRVIRPHASELSAESIAEYESEKQSMISARD